MARWHTRQLDLGERRRLAFGGPLDARAFEPARVPGDELVLDGRVQDRLQQPIGLRGRHLADALPAQRGVPGAYRGTRNPVDWRRAERRVEMTVEQTRVDLAGPRLQLYRALVQPPRGVDVESNVAGAGVEPRAAQHLGLDRGEELLCLGKGGERARRGPQLPVAEVVSGLVPLGRQPADASEPAALPAHGRKLATWRPRRRPRLGRRRSRPLVGTRAGMRKYPRTGARRGTRGARSRRNGSRWSTVRRSDQPLPVERVTGIEPAWPAWKAGALPLSYTRALSAWSRVAPGRHPLATVGPRAHDLFAGSRHM